MPQTERWSLLLGRAVGLQQRFVQLVVFDANEQLERSYFGSYRRGQAVDDPSLDRSHAVGGDPHGVVLAPTVDQISSGDGIDVREAGDQLVGPAGDASPRGLQRS